MGIEMTEDILNSTGKSSFPRIMIFLTIHTRLNGSVTIMHPHANGILRWGQITNSIQDILGGHHGSKWTSWGTVSISQQISWRGLPVEGLTNWYRSS